MTRWLSIIIVNLPTQKERKMEMPNKESKYTRFLRPIGSTLFSCCNSGKHLRREDLAVDCADCGAVFCEDCVKNGALDEHICEEDDE